MSKHIQNGSNVLTESLALGDGTNQAIIKADGEINLEGTEMVYKVVAIRPSGFGVPGTGVNA